MSVQAIAVLTDGRVVTGINYRLAAYASPYQPAVPASPYPFNGGTYHLQTAMGWIDIPASQVQSITTSGLAH